MVTVGLIKGKWTRLHSVGYWQVKTYWVVSVARPNGSDCLLVRPKLLAMMAAFLQSAEKIISFLISQYKHRPRRFKERCLQPPVQSAVNGWRTEAALRLVCTEEVWRVRATDKYFGICPLVMFKMSVLQFYLKMSPSASELQLILKCLVLSDQHQKIRVLKQHRSLSKSLKAQRKINVIIYEKNKKNVSNQVINIEYRYHNLIFIIFQKGIPNKNYLSCSYIVNMML